MLLRLLFVLLIALNIAVAAWLLLGESGSHAVEATDSGVPRLKLLAEVPAAGSTAGVPAGAATSVVAPTVASNDAPAAALNPGTSVKPGAEAARDASAAWQPAVLAGAPGSTPPSAPGPSPVGREARTAAVEKATSIALPAVPKATSKPAVPPRAASAKSPATTPSRLAQATASDAEAPTSSRRSYRCLAVGPFASEVDLRAARTAIAARTVRARQRQEQTSESHGFRVYLPAQPTRDLALAQARRLEAKGIKDYFVVTVAGELQNSVALGLFHDPANARKRRDEVIAAGFPARMSERLETIPVWWLDVVVPDDATAEVRRNLRNPAISARPTGCF